MQPGDGRLAIAAGVLAPCDWLKLTQVFWYHAWFWALSVFVSVELAALGAETW